MVIKKILPKLLVVLTIVIFSGCQKKTAEKKQIDSPEKTVQLSVKSTDAEIDQFLKTKKQINENLDQSEIKVGLSNSEWTETSIVNHVELKTFRTESLKGCDEKLNGCKNIEALKQKPNTATILILGLDGETDAKIIDQVIRLSLEVRTRTTDDRFQQIFMRLVLKNLRSLLQINSSLYTKIVITNIDSLALLTETELMSFFSGFKIFDLKDAEFPKVLRLKFLAYAFSKASMLQQNSELIKAGILSSPIYQYVQDLVVKKPTFLKFSNVGPIGFSPLEYILVSFAAGGVNSAESRDLAAMLPDKTPEQTKSITNFLRAQTIYTSHLANLSFKVELPNFLKFTDVNVFLDLCSTISVKNRALWRSYLLGLENANLISKNFSPTNPELKELIDSSKKNIQYMSSHPHLALLSYFIAKNEMVMEFKFIGIYKIHYKTVISQFLTGELNGLMAYFDNTSTLSVTDVVHSMYYAFRSGLFEDLELNAYDFINEFTKTLLADEIFRFKLDIKKWNLLSNDSGFLNQVAALNDSFKTKNFAEIRTSWDEFDVDPIYGDYIKELYSQAELCSFRAGLGSECKMTPGNGDGHNLFMNTPLTFRAEVLKNYVSGRRSIIAALVDTLRFAELENGKTKEEIDKNLATSTPLFAEFNQSYKEFVKVAINYSNKYYQIVTEMVENSRKAKIQIFMTEIEHLKKVHAYMTQIRANSGATVDAQKYLSSVNGHVDLHKYQTGETIGPAAYSANLIDHIFRMISATSEYIGKDKSKYAIVNLTDQRIRMIQNKANSDKKMVLTIPYRENLQEFLMNGMSEFFNFANGKGNDANAWFGIESVANLVYQVAYFGGYEAQYFRGIGAVYSLSELFGMDFNASQLVLKTKAAYDILNARESEMEFYKYTNSKGFFPEHFPANLDEPNFPTYDFKAGVPRPVMDSVFLSIAQPTVNMGGRNTTGSANGAGVSAGWGLPDFKMDLINLYNSNKFRGPIFFKMDAVLSAKIEENYVTLLKSSDKAVRNLQHELEARRSEVGFYALDYTSRIQVPLFDFRHVDDYNRHIEDFNIRTENHFKKYLE